LAAFRPDDIARTPPENTKFPKDHPANVPETTTTGRHAKTFFSPNTRAMMRKADLASILDMGKRPKELLAALFVNGVVIPSPRPYSSGQ